MAQLLKYFDRATDGVTFPSIADRARRILVHSEHAAILYIGLLVLILSVLPSLFQIIPSVSAACATYDSANNRIIVSCNATLPQVASEINNSTIIDDKGSGEYIIRATLETSHAKLTISSVDGVSWLKFTKDYGLYYYYANAVISGVKITSWDESTNSPIDNKGTGARAWVRFYKTTDAAIQNSEFAYLGHGTDASSKRGISFEGSSVNMHIDGSQFHHNHYAFYSNGLSASDLKNSDFHDNDMYDIDPHTATHDFLIANNHVHNSQAKFGVICSLNCYQITIDGNTIEGSPSSGISFSRNMHDSIVRNNVVFNTPSAIYVGQSPNNEIYGNTIHDVSRGIYFVNSVTTEGTTQNNFAHDNTISKATYAIISVSSSVDTVKNNNLDSASITYEYYLSGNSKLIIDSQTFNSDKIRGASGTNPIEIRNSGNISVDGGAAIDTDAAPYTTDLTNKIITVKSISSTAPPPDTMRPAVKITSPTEGQSVVNGTVPVTGTSSDETSGSGVKIVQVRVDSGSYQTATPKAAGDWSTWSINLNIPTPGSHKIQARATDNAGNSNWYSVNINVGATAPEPTPADTTKPIVKITSPANGATLPGNSTIHVTGIASDADSGVKTVQVHVDTGTYQTATPNAPGDWSTWSIDLTITTPGTHKIQARATDNAGNQNWNSIGVTIT